MLASFFAVSSGTDAGAKLVSCSASEPASGMVSAIFSTDPAMLRWFGGPYGIEIVDAVALSEPIPVRGYQTFWHVPEAEAEIIYRQVPAWRPA